MSRTSGLPVLAWVLLGLLILGAMAIGLNRQEGEGVPTTDSHAPQGVSAFAEVLRRMGYQVVADRSSRPRLEEGDVAVAFLYRDSITPFAIERARWSDPFLGALNGLLLDGRPVVLMQLEPVFRRRSATHGNDSPGAVVLYGEGSRAVLDLGYWDNERTARRPVPFEATTQPLWTWEREEATYALLAKIGEGTLVSVENGAAATNRLIDRHDNARVMASLITAVAPENGRIVFLEAGIVGAEEPGLLRSIGAWAVGAWYQLLFLGLVVAYTLGKRFGLPVESRSAQRGSREFVDALADTLERGRHGVFGLEASLVAADRRLRSLLRLPRDASRQERDRHLPESLVRTLAEAEAALEMPKVPEAEALRMTKNIERELWAYEREGVGVSRFVGL
jgi:hypothetical protein